MFHRYYVPALGILLFGTLIIGVAVWASPSEKASSDYPPAIRSEGRSALILIEFQNEWLGDEGKLVRLFDHPERGQVAAKHAKVALDAARESGMVVIHAPMILSPGYPELGDGKYGLRAAIPQAGTWIGDGAAFADGFEPIEGEPVVQGRVGASAFVGSNLKQILDDHGITTIYLAGFATHVCIESTMRHGHDLAYDVIVLRDACAAFNDEQDAYFDEHVLHHFAHAKPVEAFVAKMRSQKK